MFNDHNYDDDVELDDYVDDDRMSCHLEPLRFKITGLVLNTSPIMVPLQVVQENKQPSVPLL